jgi:phytoene dehydrogenase-like protein
MQKKYDAIIIGSGIGGLVCASYLVRSGLEVLILEQLDSVGGCCSSFERDGNMFDVGAHYLGGVESGYIGEILDELALKDAMNFLRFDPSEEIRFLDKRIVVRQNFLDTRDALIQEFPTEKLAIERFIAFLKERDVPYLYRQLYSLTFDNLLKEFFRDSDLRRFFSALTFCNKGLPADEIAAISAVIFLREYIFDSGYCPVGGMKQFPEILTRRFVESGGDIRLSTKVSRVALKYDRVAGVETTEGFFESGMVVSNMDASKTFTTLLDVESKERKRLGALVASTSMFVVCLPIDCFAKSAVSEEEMAAPSVGWFFSKDFGILSRNDVEAQKELSWVLCSSTSSNSDGGIQAMTSVEYQPKKFWDEHKAALAGRLTAHVEKNYPHCRIDPGKKIVITPADYENYTSNYHGAAFGWRSTTEQLNSNLMPLRTSIPGLYLTGHWATFGMGQGGVPGAAMCGKNTAKVLLTDLGKGRWIGV